MEHIKNIFDGILVIGATAVILKYFGKLVWVAIKPIYRERFIVEDSADEILLAIVTILPISALALVAWLIGYAV